MCAPDPLTISLLSGAAQLGGTFLKNEGQNKVQEERDRVLRSENARQRGMRNESQQQIAKTTSQMTRGEVDQNQNEAALERMEVAPNEAIPDSGEYAQTVQSAPSVVKSEIARQVSDAVRRGRRNVKNKAKLDAYGDSGFQSQLELLRSGDNVNSIAGRMIGSSQVTPFELQDANLKGRNYSLAGDIASGAGQIGMLYGLTSAIPKAGSPLSVADTATGGMSYVNPITGTAGYSQKLYSGGDNVFAGGSSIADLFTKPKKLMSMEQLY
jgi:hypothetical protein